MDSDKNSKAIIKKLNEINYVLLGIQTLIGVSTKKQNTTNREMIFYLFIILGITAISNLSIALLHYSVIFFYLAFAMIGLVVFFAVILMFFSWQARKNEEKFIDTAKSVLDDMRKAINSEAENLDDSIKKNVGEDKKTNSDK